MLETLAAVMLLANPPPAVKVMAFNVLYKGADDAASVKAIASRAPDVLCLTELTDPFVKAFDAKLKSDYPYRHFETTQGTWGVGLASKFPIVSVASTPVPPLKLPAMEAQLSVRGQTLAVTCVHLNPPAGKHKKSDSFTTTLEKNADVREKQAQWLVERYAKLTGPLLVVGDFNEESVGRAMKTFAKAGLADACDQANNGGCGPTFPGPAEPWPAVFTIDHLLGRKICFSKGEVVRAGGSDHYPIAGELQLGACVKAK